MKPIVASAAGKIFVAGEYAVLWGGSALVSAAGPRSYALLKERSDASVHLRHGETSLEGFLTSSGILWRSEVQKQLHFAAVTAAIAVSVVGRTNGFDIDFQPSPLAPNGQKLGLGSSARATVLTAALCLHGRRDCDHRGIALLAHKVAQNGAGSGGDVLACATGGMIRFRQVHAGEEVAGEHLSIEGKDVPNVDCVSLPPSSICLGYAYSGRSASTTTQIANLAGALSGPQRIRFVSESSNLVDYVETAIRGSDFDSLKRAVFDLQAMLTALPGVVVCEHQAILREVQRFGCTGKVSGAGGGDGCVLFAPDPESLTNAMRHLASLGYYAFEVERQRGVHIEPLMERLPST